MPFVSNMSTERCGESSAQHTVEERAAEGVSACHCWFVVVRRIGLGHLAGCLIGRKLKGNLVEEKVEGLISAVWYGVYTVYTAERAR